jgi:hypothetical protein
MGDRLCAIEDEDLLMERLIQVENALFCLKVRSSCIDSPEDDCEIQRLERMRRELHDSYAQMYQRPPERLSRQDAATV